MMSVRLLSHSELKSAVRGRVCFVDCLCATLGWHNGRAAPPAKSMQFEEPSPGPILGFLDSICKVNLNSDSAFFWLENITSVGSAFFMLMDGPISQVKTEGYFNAEQGVLNLERYLLGVLTRVKAAHGDQNKLSDHKSEYPVREPGG